MHLTRDLQKPATDLTRELPVKRNTYSELIVLWGVITDITIISESWSFHPAFDSPQGLWGKAKNVLMDL